MKNIIGMIIGIIAGMVLFFTLFIGAILQNANYRLTGTVLKQTENSCLVEYEDGNIYEIESDDLVTGDQVVTWFYRNEPIKTIYTGN